MLWGINKDDTSLIFKSVHSQTLDTRQNIVNEFTEASMDPRDTNFAAEK